MLRELEKGKQWKKQNCPGTINRQAHVLAASSFAAVRASLEAKARALLDEGKSLDETLAEIRVAGLRDETREQ